MVAMGIGGMEKGLSNLPFASHFAEASASGLHTVAHAGEHGGPESIRSALDHCRAERIDHGIRAIDDPSLVAHLAERGTPLDVCPSSNVALCAVPSLEQHPLPLLRDAGVALTINSDDPPFFGTSLTREYLLLHRTWGIPLDELAALSHGALRHAFVPEAERPELERRFREELAASGCARPAPARAGGAMTTSESFPRVSAPDGRNGATVPVRGLFETHVTVARLDPAVAFYRDVVGLELAALFEARRVAFFWIGGRGQSMLGVWEAGTAPNSMRVHLAFTCEPDEVVAAPAGCALSASSLWASIASRSTSRSCSPGCRRSRSTSTTPTATCSSTWRCCPTSRGPTSAWFRTVSGSGVAR